ncbi:uncharacterized, partial [Tachysurus ichikawai]
DSHQELEERRGEELKSNQMENTDGVLSLRIYDLLLIGSERKH